MKAITIEKRAANKGHYSPGMVAGGMVFVSGQLPVNYETGELAKGGIGEQTETALKNLEQVLRAAGAARENVVFCRVYIPDVSLWDEANRVYAEFFGSHKPGRVVVPTGELHFGALVEIEAVAELPAKLPKEE